MGWPLKPAPQRSTAQAAVVRAGCSRPYHLHRVLPCSHIRENSRLGSNGVLSAGGQAVASTSLAGRRMWQPSSREATCLGSDSGVPAAASGYDRVLAEGVEEGQVERAQSGSTSATIEGAPAAQAGDQSEGCASGDQAPAGSGGGHDKVAGPWVLNLNGSGTALYFSGADAIRAAFPQLHGGDVSLPLRTAVYIRTEDGQLLEFPVTLTSTGTSVILHSVSKLVKHLDLQPGLRVLRLSRDGAGRVLAEKAEPSQAAPTSGDLLVTFSNHPSGRYMAGAAAIRAAFPQQVASGGGVAVLRTQAEDGSLTGHPVTVWFNKRTGVPLLTSVASVVDALGLRPGDNVRLSLAGGVVVAERAGSGWQPLRGRPRRCDASSGGASGGTGDLGSSSKDVAETAEAPGPALWQPVGSDPLTSGYLPDGGGGAGGDGARTSGAAVDELGSSGGEGPEAGEVAKSRSFSGQPPTGSSSDDGGFGPCFLNLTRSGTNLYFSGADAIRAAFPQLTEGDVHLPLRTAVYVRMEDGQLLRFPITIQTTGTSVVLSSVSKLVSHLGLQPGLRVLRLSRDGAGRVLAEKAPPEEEEEEEGDMVLTEGSFKASGG